MQTPLFSLQKVQKHYPVLGGVLKKQVGKVSVLNGIDLSINEQEITGLVGESGCGKSTLAKLLMRLETPSAGTLLFEGQPLGKIGGNDRKQFYRKVQMVFQDPFSSLNPRMRIKDIVGEMIRIQGVGKEQEKERVLKILKQVELDVDAMERFPHEFSGGQRQRIAIARALIVEPKILIADEPVSALDLSLQAKTLALLKELKKAFDLTIFLISHDLKTVGRFCDTVAVMYLGRIVEQIPGHQLLSQAKHPYTQALINSMPITNPEQRGKKRSIIQGEVPSPINLPPGCTFHSRCPKRLDQCDQAVPTLKQVGNPHHQLACFLSD